MILKLNAIVTVKRTVSGRALVPASAQEVAALKAQLESWIAATGPVTLALDDDGNLIATGNAIVESVTSVNGLTGAVNLSNTDVGAFSQDNGEEAYVYAVNGLKTAQANEKLIYELQSRCTAIETQAKTFVNDDASLRAVKELAFDADTWTVANAELSSGKNSVMFSLGSFSSLIYNSLTLKEITGFQIWQGGTKVVDSITIRTGGADAEGYALDYNYLSPAGYSMRIKKTSGTFSDSLTAGCCTVWLKVGGSAVRKSVL